MKAETLLYPERQRCRTCRQFFGWAILDRLYCSRKCAGLGPEPSLKDAPRKCVTPRPKAAGGRTWKTRHFYPHQAQILAYEGQSTYYCDNCHTWHNGTPRQSKEVRDAQGKAAGNV